MAQARQTGCYPADWDRIAFAIKADARWRCVRCFHPNDPAAGYSLGVHHLDGDKGNCQRWNLPALCQRCHLHVQATVNMEVGLLIEPAAWFIPYVCGFYEAGRGVPGPLYSLAAWRDRYVRESGPWPVWAPQPFDAFNRGDYVRLNAEGRVARPRAPAFRVGLVAHRAVRVHRGTVSVRWSGKRSIEYVPVRLLTLAPREEVAHAAR